MSDKLLIIRELKSQLSRNKPEDIHDVILYGSQLQDHTERCSDYDVLIILNKKYPWSEKRKIRDICYEISLKFDILIDSKIISTQELQSDLLKNHPLYKDALNQGIHA